MFNSRVHIPWPKSGSIRRSAPERGRQITLAAKSTRMSRNSKKAKLEELVVKFSDMFPEVTNITAPELRALLEDPNASPPVVLVDVRLPEEIAVSVIPASQPHTLLTEAQFEARKEELRGSLIVAYCTAGYRSAKFAQRAQREGFQARNLSGSILSWTQEGYPLVMLSPSGPAGEGAAQPAPQPTKKVHVYGKQWALQGEGYEPVMFSRPLLQTVKSLGASVLEKVGLGRLLGS